MVELPIMGEFADLNELSVIPIDWPPFPGTIDGPRLLRTAASGSG